MCSIDFSYKLTPHFALGEFFVTSYSSFKKSLIEEYKSIPFCCGNLVRVASCLEMIRSYIGKPIKITSGFRSVFLNCFVHGSSTSNHLVGLAADFTFDGFSQKSASYFSQMLSDLVDTGEFDYDQFIYYPKKNFVHFGLSKSDKKPRRQFFINA